MQPIPSSRPVIPVALAALNLLVTPAAAPQSVPDLYRLTDATSRNHMEYHPLRIPAGGEFVLGDLKGPGKVTYFYITDDSAARFYPGLVLKIFWDDESTPSVLVPLSDFFGTFGARTIDFQSALIKINHGCYMCYAPMPFSRRARWVLANDGDRDYHQSDAYGIDYETGAAYADDYTSVAFWYQAEPHQPLTLPSFAERTAPSRAGAPR